MPERPRLAPGVRLAGQLRESAFKDPPWLVEREGAGYVQLTELLYRIAEGCDGRQTLAEIARGVSEATGRSVSADNVKQLVATQLMLKGLVPTADGKVVGAAGASRSLLALSMRMKMIGPELLEAPSRLLQVLFWPPVLAVLLFAALLAEGWLFFVHGVAAGARDVLYQPTLLVVALAVTALAAGFHELGHAAALRFGGGTPKGMGVGIYLVYPAFYTDVSDNYRLSRWARVRTDLGGIYFHLVFALAVFGLYLATGQEFLLLVVMLLNLDAFRQLMPLMRFDGYWTLADVTGVPDFFSYMGTFVRRFLPGTANDAGDSKLPELKWWGTAAFATYMLIAVPLLLFMIFVMLRAAPTTLATAVDSAGGQLDGFRQAQAAGDGLGMAASVGQLLVLALPTLGLVYSLFRFGRRLTVGVWNWSTPTPTRRVIGGLGTVAALGGLAYLWAPQLPFGRGEPGPLYTYTTASFSPIPREARGTVFDAANVAPPTWVPVLDWRPSQAPSTPSDEEAADEQPPASTADPAASPGPASALDPSGTPVPDEAAGAATPGAEPTAGAGIEPGATAGPGATAEPGGTAEPGATVEADGQPASSTPAATSSTAAATQPAIDGTPAPTSATDPTSAAPPLAATSAPASGASSPPTSGPTSGPQPAATSAPVPAPAAPASGAPASDAPAAPTSAPLTNPGAAGPAPAPTAAAPATPPAQPGPTSAPAPTVPSAPASVPPATSGPVPTVPPAATATAPTTAPAATAGPTLVVPSSTSGSSRSSGSSGPAPTSSESSAVPLLAAPAASPAPAR